jgi:phosphohistidine phosphatase SixA
MSQGKLKMWVGLGSYLLSGVASTVIATQINPAAAENVDPTAPPMFLQLLAGGEGGETAEGEKTAQAFKAMQLVVARTQGAIAKGDFNAAKIEFAKFEDSWKTVEGGVKTKNPNLYNAIEASLTNTEKGLESKNKDQSLAALQTLSSSIDVASGLKVVAAVPSAGGEGGEGGEGGASVTPSTYGNGDSFVNKVSDADLLKSLRQGGYVIYIRHAQTDKDYADQADPKLDLSNCGTQRTLSEMGWAQAKSIGAGFRAARIPVGNVISSDYCRAWQTADLAFGTYKRDSALNFAKSEEYNAAQRLQMKTAVMPLLTAMPRSGTNTVLVGHDDVFDSATGIYPKPQGMAYILKPDGRGKFEILAKMPAEGWMMLAK